MNKANEDCSTFSAQVRALDQLDSCRSIQVLAPSFIQQILNDQYQYYRLFCQQHQFATDWTFSARLYLVSWTYHFDKELILGPFTPSPIEQLNSLGTTKPDSTKDYLVITPSSAMTSTISELERRRGPLALYIASHTKDP